MKPVAYAMFRDGKYYDAITLEEHTRFEGGYTIPLYTHPAKTSAKQRYDDCMKDCDEPNSVERLRFFLSCALTGQDWLDVEPFIDAISHPAKTLTEEQVIDITKAFFNIHPETHLTEKFNIPLYELTHFARAILRKAQEK